MPAVAGARGTPTNGALTMHLIRTGRLFVIAGLALGPLPAYAQARAADPADVGTIAGIVRATYDVMNGPAGHPRQWPRDETLYMPGATFVSMSETDGRVESHTLTPEEFRRGFDVSRGFYETEIGRRTERFGNVAQVRSVAVVRSTADGPVEERYVNYFQMYWDGARWWITGIIWDVERPNARIPEAWIGRWEEVVR
jgi:hypothetical protein